MLNSIDWGPVSAFGSSITWAVGITTYSLLSRRFSPPAINLLRAVLSLPFFVLLLCAQSHGVEGALQALREVTPSAGWLALSVVMSYAVGDFLFMWSTHSMGVPGALAIASTYPLWSALGGWFFKGESMSALGVAGLCAAVGGTCAVILAGRGAAPALNGDPAPRVVRGGAVVDSESKLPWRERYRSGVILAVATSLVWGLNAFALSKVPSTSSMVAGNALRMAMCLVLIPLFGYFMAPGAQLWLSPRTAGRHLPAFLLESCVGASLFLYGLSHSPLAVGAALTSLAPVLSLPVALMLGRERISRLRVMGVVAVVAGIWLLVSR